MGWPASNRRGHLQVACRHHSWRVKRPFRFESTEYHLDSSSPAPGGDLLDYINAQRSGVAEDEARYIFQQLVGSRLGARQLIGGAATWLHAGHAAVTAAGCMCHRGIRCFVSTISDQSVWFPRRSWRSTTATGWE